MLTAYQQDKRGMWDDPVDCGIHQRWYGELTQTASVLRQQSLVLSIQHSYRQVSYVLLTDVQQL